MAPGLNLLLYLLLPFADGAISKAYSNLHGGTIEDLQGEFCHKRTWVSTGVRAYKGDYYSECCDGRVDDCSVPILGTLCYCDQFCDRGASHDCCPDYWKVCFPVNTTTPPTTTTEVAITCPPEPTTKGCKYDGKFYPFEKTININCNTCICRNGDWDCSSKKCLIEYSVASSLQQMPDLSWTPVDVDINGKTSYVSFMNKTLSEGLSLRLGTINPEESMTGMQTIQYIIENSMPPSFDGRHQWHSLISPVLDQGWCASSWALAATSVISDRAAISDGKDKEFQYEQFLACHKDCNVIHDRCSKGHLHIIWKYLSDYGAPEKKCVDAVGVSESECRDGGKCKRFKSGPAYRLGDIDRMQHNLMVYGPLQATMRVYQDFFHYKSGVYSRSEGSDHRENFGYHSVRIVGWGEAKSTSKGPPIPYWLVANSWGTWWGEKGYFRIRRGVNECDIESYVLSAWIHPELALAESR